MLNYINLVATDGDRIDNTGDVHQVMDNAAHAYTGLPCHTGNRKH